MSERCETIQINPWIAQGIVFETIQTYLLNNPPEKVGYPIRLKYDTDKFKSDILLEIAYNYDASIANKRPAIFISRGDCAIRPATMGGMIGSHSEESLINRFLLNSANLNVAVIAAPIMKVELLADYVKQAISSFQYEIQHDFGFRKFRLTGVSRPQIYVEAKEYFVINLNIETVYDEHQVVVRNDLKLKKANVALTLFDALTCKKD